MGVAASRHGVVGEVDVTVVAVTVVVSRKCGRFWNSGGRNSTFGAGI